MAAAAAIPVGAVAGNPFYDYLTGTLFFPQELAERIFAQGIDDFDELIEMDDSLIRDMVDNIRKPGGYIAVAGRGGGRGAAAARGRGREADRGHAVTEVARTRMRQLAYYCYHLHRIERVFVAAEATLVRLRELWQQKRNEDDQKDVEYAKPELMKTDTGDKAFNAIKVLDQYLYDKRGCRGSPLAYLTRADATPPAEADDLGYGLPTFADELIRRAPSTGITRPT